MNPTIWRARTVSYQNSFFPAATKAWRELPIEIRNAATLQAFKRKLKAQTPPVPKYYLAGKRANQMIHAKMRMECSDLNYHLFLRYIQDEHSCQCGAPVEDPDHFFRTCPLYTDLRNEIFGVDIPNIHTILNGYDDSDTDNNGQMIIKVHNFIEKSGRF